MLRRRELSASAQDAAALERFYSELYVLEFPHPNERESLENMQRHLQLKAEGWYGRNSYHILIIEDDLDVLAGSVSDYLAEANAGVIEFLVVSPRVREKGVGRRLLDWTERTLQEDAVAAGARIPDCVAAEMDDPFKPCGVSGSIDPFRRTEIWGKWGYKKLDFPYVQPALSDRQEPVHHLLLMAKPLVPEFETELPAERVQHILREYMRWAMRIDDPETNAEYREMHDFVERRGSVQLTSLRHYIGHDERRPLVVHEIKDPADQALDQVLAVYGASFADRPTAVPPYSFSRNLTDVSTRLGVYHLWALRTRPTGEIDGMASFFTFPPAGFGGYVAFATEARGRGRLRPLIARIERRMRADFESARGWYVESDSDASLQIFLRLGFYEVDVVYRQPPLSGGHGDGPDAAPVLRLLYKEFGSVYQAPHVDSTELLSAMTWIYRAVYGIDKPRESAFFQAVAEQLPAHGPVPFK